MKRRLDEILESLDMGNLMQMRELMAYSSEVGDMPLSGTNEDGEVVLTTVESDRVIFRTYQDNGWLRTNIIHEDGSSEELYSRS